MYKQNNLHAKNEPCQQRFTPMEIYTSEIPAYDFSKYRAQVTQKGSLSIVASIVSARLIRFNG